MEISSATFRCFGGIRYLQIPGNWSRSDHHEQSLEVPSRCEHVSSRKHDLKKQNGVRRIYILGLKEVTIECKGNQVKSKEMPLNNFHETYLSKLNMVNERKYKENEIDIYIGLESWLYNCKSDTEK